jgi:hypothetical protein
VTPIQVELLQWFVTEGQSIKAFDRICEVQSDKATVEISSRYDGKVRPPTALITGSVQYHIIVASPSSDRF